MDNTNKIIDMLEKKYKTFLLTKVQLAEILSLSVSGINNLLSKNSDNLPEHIKMGVGAKSSIRFSIISIANYLSKDKELKNV